MHVDRSSIIDTAWAALALIVISIGGQTPGTLGGMLTAFGFGLLFMGVIIQTWIFQMITQSYQYMEIQLRPSREVLHVFVKKMTSHRTDRLHWSTRCELAWPVKHSYYGKIAEFTLHHAYPREKRFNFDHGECNYMGYWIDHPRVERIVAYEFPKGSFDLDHSNPIPAFHVAEASNDYFLEFPSSSINPSSMASLKGENMRLTHTASENKRQAMKYQQLYIREEEKSKHIQNELAGVLKGELDFDSAVTERMLAHRRAQLTIENALKSRAWYKKLTLTKTLALLILGVVTVTLIFFDPSGVFTTLLEWIHENTTVTIIALVVLAMTVFFILRRKRQPEPVTVV